MHTILKIFLTIMFSILTMSIVRLFENGKSESIINIKTRNDTKYNQHDNELDSKDRKFFLSAILDVITDKIDNLGYIVESQVRLIIEMLSDSLILRSLIYFLVHLLIPILVHLLVSWMERRNRNLGNIGIFNLRFFNIFAPDPVQMPFANGVPDIPE